MTLSDISRSFLWSYWCYFVCQADVQYVSDNRAATLLNTLLQYFGKSLEALPGVKYQNRIKKTQFIVSYFMLVEDYTEKRFRLLEQLL